MKAGLREPLVRGSTDATRVVHCQETLRVGGRGRPYPVELVPDPRGSTDETHDRPCIVHCLRCDREYLRHDQDSVTASMLAGQCLWA